MDGPGSLFAVGLENSDCIHTMNVELAGYIYYGYLFSVKLNFHHYALTCCKVEYSIIILTGNSQLNSISHLCELQGMIEELNCQQCYTCLTVLAEPSLCHEL